MNLLLEKMRFDRALSEALDWICPKQSLFEPCKYALLSGGKRLRPLLALMTADALGHGIDVTTAAIGIECFHAASLIIDDLPCMDDDDMRRGKPSLHVAFGESTAILAGFSLMAAGYGSVSLMARELGGDATSRAIIALDVATQAARSATQGQLLDLTTPEASLEALQGIVYQKTITLFEVALAWGWLFGGGAIDKLKAVHKIAYHLGMAFQIADDLDDVGQDKSVTIASLLGKEKATALVLEQVACLEKALKEVSLFSKPFQKIVSFLYAGASSRTAAFLGKTDPLDIFA
ncbi:MAG: geranyltranstransferase [Chlamydiota bacterium]|jgi:geranylgeranyl diphosphate synthase type II